MRKCYRKICNHTASSIFKDCGKYESFLSDNLSVHKRKHLLDSLVKLKESIKALCARNKNT